MKLFDLLNEDGIDIDIYDNNYDDYGVAFVLDNDRPQDNYELFLEHLAKHLDVIESVGNPIANCTVDLAGYIEGNIKAYYDTFKNKNVESNIRNVISMISGNAPECLYKELLDNLGEKTISIPEDSEEEAL